MVSTNKNTSNGDATADLQAIMSDIASLKNDIAALAGNLSSSAVNATSDATSRAASQIGEQASRVYDNIAAQSQRSAKVVSQQVEAQPITTLLIAFAVGFVGSRLLTNNAR